MTVKIYGIKNCGTMKKAFRWLEDNNIAYDFHDYKKEGVDTEALKQAIEAHSWDTVINRRGTTWRQLPDSVKENMDASSALTAATENPSLIKRPLLVKNGQTYLGFNEEDYKKQLK
ncbi:MAG: ArsC family reductase [Rhodospirillales bacterium]|nr:ArsC family reductase [Rhodospirillales bacterium]MCB9995342.1 ArsC family reductase [Rhodospirillales bacterium]